MIVWKNPRGNVPIGTGGYGRGHRSLSFCKDDTGHALPLYALPLYALPLSAHLFVRPGELRQAEWMEFDLDRSVWNLPA